MSSMMSPEQARSVADAFEFICLRDVDDTGTERLCASSSCRSVCSRRVFENNDKVRRCVCMAKKGTAAACKLLSAQFFQSNFGSGPFPDLNVVLPRLW